LARIYKNITIAHVSYTYQKWEYPTLEFLHSYVLQQPNDLNILYLHLKGVTRQNDQAVTDWRNLLDYGVIECWKTAVEELKSYDVCGVNWIPRVYCEITRNFKGDRDEIYHTKTETVELSSNHFNGNFWWATSQYIKSLEPPENPVNDFEFSVGTNPGMSSVSPEKRIIYEFWLGTKNPRWSSIINTMPHHKGDGGWHYRNLWPEKNYRNRPLNIDRYGGHPIYIEGTAELDLRFGTR
jgi:hypothetical protein